MTLITKMTFVTTRSKDQNSNKPLWQYQSTFRISNTPMVTHPHSIIHWCPSNPTNNKHMRTSRIIFTYHNHHCNPQLRHRALPKAPTKPPLPVIARRSKTLGWQNGQQRYAESSKCWMNELFSLLQYQLLFVCV